MNAFVSAVKNQEARTENGMKARVSTTSANVDLFFKLGASRGKNVIGPFTAAYVEDQEKAIRIALWVRDVRQGAGERQIFRDIMLELEQTNPDLLLQVMRKVPELGRWDDLLIEFKTERVIHHAYNMIGEALRAGEGLCAKWMPRQGDQARALRTYLAYSPKQWRKRLVALTKVVETQMCAKDWNNINFSHVPSLASARYKKAFGRNAKEVYTAYIEALVKGTDPKVKVNAAAVYPYDILKGFISGYGWSNPPKLEVDHAVAQWNALPNYVGDSSVLAMVDVSGSMGCAAGGTSTTVKCIDVAVSLGLYVADKNLGPFKDTFLTFTGQPELLHLKGNIAEKCKQMATSAWQQNTNLHAAFDKILTTAIQHKVPASEMPGTLLIMSDMQFDQCGRFDDSAHQMICRKFEAAGYNVPQIVFWNINARDNVPVKFDTRGVALVSGFSPSILKAVMAADMEQFTPEAIMNKTIMSDRYKI